MAVRVFEMDHRYVPPPHGMSMVAMPFISSQSFAAAADGAARSAALNAATRVIVVQADEKVAVRLGAGTPTAAASDYQIEAGGERVINVLGTGLVLAARTL